MRTNISDMSTSRWLGATRPDPDLCVGTNGEAATSAAQPAEHDGGDREQREGRQDAADEGEAEANRHRARSRLGASPQIGADFGRDTSERGRGGRSESRTGS